MNAKSLEKYKGICESLGWSCYDPGFGDVRLSQETPAGEDFDFYVATENLVDGVKAFASDFDPEEHIEKWIMAKYEGVEGVPCASVLVKDAYELNEMLEKLAMALCKARAESDGGEKGNEN